MTNRPRPGPGAETFDLDFVERFDDFAAARRGLGDGDSGMMR
jgi:hypothetical protein